jgi:hypothetical protein
MLHSIFGTATTLGAGLAGQTANIAGAIQLLPAPALANASGTILTVGAGEEFSSLSAACAAAQNGDTILVKAGTYVNDFADVTTNVTIRSFGGRANFVATVPPANLKGILTVDASCTVEGLTFSGASIPQADGGNAAGIRYEGGVMVLEHDSFSNNQDGVMGTPVLGLAENTVTIDHCLFQNNGDGDGYTHNAYIGTVTSLIFTNNVSEGAIVGHELKSRAYSNTIENNIFRDGATGNASYQIDLPNGGADVVSNNIIQKGPCASNEVFIHFGGEGIPYAGSSLLVEGNTFRNAYGAGAIGVLNQTPYTADVTGNVFSNFGHATLAAGPATETNNVNGQGRALPNTTLTGILPGNTVIFTDDNPHTITLAGTIMAVEGGGGLLTATAVSGHVIALGGAGGMNFAETGASGGNTVTTNAGSTNTLNLIGQDVVSSCGTDMIQCGTCNVTGQVSGTATILDGSGNNTWDVAGTATITGQGGNPVVSVAPGGDASINGTLGYLYVQNNGGNFALSVGESGYGYSMTDQGGAVTACVAGSGTTIDTAAGPIGATLTLGAGNYTVTSAGPDTINAGSGNDTVILEGAATVYAGTGSLSIYGRSDPGSKVYGNGGTYLLAGDTGNITYLGGALASTVTVQLYNVTLIGGSGQLSVYGGSDNTLIGGAGGLNYVASDGGGADHITTQAGATDALTLGAADTVNAYGNDTISEGSGNQVLNVYGNSTILGGTGSNTVLLAGNDTLYGVGQDFVTVAARATATILAGGNTVVQETGASQVQFSQYGAMQASLSGGSAVIQGGSADGAAVTISTTAGMSTAVTLGAGNAVVTSYGADSIVAGMGTAAVTLYNTASITGGSGALTISSHCGSLGQTQTITGGSGTLSYTQDNGTLNFIGGSGNTVIDGGAGALFITGGAGSLTVTGGNAGLYFIAGNGAATITATPSGGTVEFGAGATSVQEATWGAGLAYDFVAGHGGGMDTILGFRPGTDTLVFNGVGVAAETIAGGNTMLQLTDSTQVALMGWVDAGHIY